jgi:predicted CopG family antitoxin
MYDDVIKIVLKKKSDSISDVIKALVKNEWVWRENRK